MRSKPTTTTVDVLEAERPLYGYTEDDEGHYSRTRLGMMTTREFQGEDVNRLYYRPAIVTPGDDDTQKTYTMGHVSDQFQVIDHAEVLKPLIAIGYTIVKIHYHRGGLNMLATLEPAKPLTLKDPLRWDKGQWDDSHNSGTIRESLFVTSGMKPGRGIHLRRRWFRQICTNGLVGNFHTPGSFDYEGYLARQGIYLTAFLWDDSGIEHTGWQGNRLREFSERLRRKIGAFFSSRLAGQTSAVLRALIIGDEGGLTKDTRTAFARAGVAHVLSISGLHIRLVATASYGLWWWLLGRSRYLLLRFLMPKIAALLTLIPVLLYAGLSGGNVATWRSVTMVATYLFAILCNRQEKSIVASPSPLF